MTDGVPQEAWDLLTAWLPSNDDTERPAMILSTIDPSGAPDARTVLLSDFDEAGFHFNTDAASRKIADLAAHPEVALVFFWPSIPRQLVVQGVAAAAPAARLALAYARRSPYLQQLAWLNTHDFATLPRSSRVAEWASFAAAHPEGFAQPPRWVGYVVRPTRLTFWSSDQQTASQRVEFALDAGSWSRRVLAG